MQQVVILALGQAQERRVSQQIKDLKGCYIDRGKRQQHKEFQMDEEWVEVIWKPRVGFKMGLQFEFE